MKTLFAAAVAVSLLTGTMAAQADNDRGRDHDRGRQADRHHDDRGRRDDHHDRGRHDRNDRHDQRRHVDNNRRNDWDRRNDWHRHNDNRRDYGRRDYNYRDSYRAGYVNGRVDQHRFDRGRYIPPRGFYHHAWRHGDHLPRAYYSTRYVVHDYHAYHLRPPPRGYHWVRVNNDVLLAAVTSGLVVSVVNGLFY